MNREIRFEGSDRLVVVDRMNRRRNIIVVAVVITLVVAAVALAMMMNRGKRNDAPVQAAADGGKGGQIPTVSVIVPGLSAVARTVTASGANHPLSGLKCGD